MDSFHKVFDQSLSLLILDRPARIQNWEIFVGCSFFLFELL